MEWRDEGLLLAARPHGESAAILDVFTPEHGRHSGILRGGQSRRHAPMLQPGNRLDLSWRARLDDHMGIFTAEPLQSRGALLDDRMALAGLNAVLALLAFTLAERDPHGSLYHQTGQLLDHLSGTPGWAVLYLRWEGLLLEELGYGLDLDCCAVTGTTEDLRYVSPRSGRAVSQAGAGAWSDRLLPLPACLRNADDDPPRADLLDGFKTTGFFLEHRLAADLGQSALPEARARLITLLSRSGEK